MLRISTFVNFVFFICSFSAPCSAASFASNRRVSCVPDVCLFFQCSPVVLPPPPPMCFKRVGQVCGSKRANFERGAQGQGNAHQQAQAPPGRSVGRSSYCYYFLELHTAVLLLPLGTELPCKEDLSLISSFGFYRWALKRRGSPSTTPSWSTRRIWLGTSTNPKTTTGVEVVEQVVEKEEEEEALPPPLPHRHRRRHHRMHRRHRARVK